MSCIASIIIPTHNRSASLNKLLERLQQQTFPFQSFEVIVVADGCKDNTVETVKKFKSSFQILLRELSGSGAAAARNAGAAMASGNWIIFLDDDMDPHEDFIEQHLALGTDRSVVIGYSPLRLEKKASIQRMGLRQWWEDKFQEMRDKYHRFKYSDLTSGNFSISATLFRKIGGFDTSMKCREDYELGFRLIEARAQFLFACDAVAFHNDAITSFHRSLQRKREEGRADAQMKKLHPHFINKQAAYYLTAYSFLKRIYIKCVWHIPSLLDVFANITEDGAVMLQRLKLRSAWLKTNHRLHEYWYLRGLFERLHSYKDVKALRMEMATIKEAVNCTIDLQEGLESAELKIDKIKPLVVDVFFGEKKIGTIAHEPGYEPLKGIHLRKIVKEQFTGELYPALQKDCC